MPFPPKSTESLFTDEDVQATTPEPLDVETAWRISFSATTYLRNILKGFDRSDPEVNRIVIGGDNRPGTKSIYKAVRDGILSSDAGAVDLGLVDWPQLCLAVNELKTAGGILVTGGLQPGNVTGMRIVSQRARAVASDAGLNEIARISARVVAHGKPPMTEAKRQAVLEAYRAAIAAFLPSNTGEQAVTVVCDALGGVMHKIAPAVLAQIPGLVMTSVEPQLDISLPATASPDPSQDAALAPLQADVAAQQASFGLTFDGDGRRVRVCDDAGRLLNAVVVAGVIAPVLLAEQPGGMVLFDAQPPEAVEAAVVRAGGAITVVPPGPAGLRKPMADMHALLGVSSDHRLLFREFYSLECPLAAAATLVKLVSSTGQSLSTHVDALGGPALS